MTESEFDVPAQVEEAFNRAMVSNDVAQIAECVTDDWVLVTPEAGVISRARILDVIARGMLSHDTMTKDVQRVQVYGEVAVVTGRGQNTGRYEGHPIVSDEWVTDVYRLIDGQWRCALTHLTPAATPGRAPSIAKAAPGEPVTAVLTRFGPGDGQVLVIDGGKLVGLLTPADVTRAIAREKVATN